MPHILYACAEPHLESQLQSEENRHRGGLQEAGTHPWGGSQEACLPEAFPPEAFPPGEDRHQIEGNQRVGDSPEFGREGKREGERKRERRRERDDCHTVVPAVLM